MRKILLNKSRSKESINKTNFIPVELNREMSLFHDESLSDTIDALKVYDDEKNASTKHRFIFTLYPLCTNILFNKITEIVYKEGSNQTNVLTNKQDSSTLISGKGQKSAQTLNRIQAIRNTEYSNKNFDFTYHCGLDIFNNHLLRAKEDVSVQKKYQSIKEGCDVYLDTSSNAYETSNFRTLNDAFNTIGDVVRNNSGKYVYTYLPNPNNYYLYTNNFKVITPLYLFDTIYTFEEGYKNSVKRQDGWIGFNNPSTLRIPVGASMTLPNSTSGASVGKFENVEDYYVNRCINNKEGCEFIDLYPERDLFYFTPKKNEYRQRIEKNWDYCLTYPYKSVYEDPTNTILKGKKMGIIFVKNEDNTTYREYVANNGVEMALFCSPVKHNLKVGDKVYLNFAQKQNNTLSFLGRVKCSVVSLGKGRDYEDRYFSVRMSDFHDYINSANEIVGFTKVVQGNLMCEYYFRLFKKFDGNYDSVLNRLAFSGTVYGDDVSQIVYTDDIDIKDYRDNHGRPLTEVYLTILKANRGHEEWYENKDYTNSNIEFSHAFGKVTSGLDLPDYISNKDFPSIRYQHNINTSAPIFDKANKTVNESSSKLESDITIEEDTFYGDFVEFNPMTLNETILEDVYHRFNTAQREYVESGVNEELYGTLYYDEIASDIYDANTTTATKPRIRNYTLNVGYANIDPEGYIYKPHHKITIGQFENTVNQGDDTIMGVSNVKINNKSHQLSFETSLNYSLLPTDIVAMVSKDGYLFKFIVTSYTWDSDKDRYVGVADFYSGDALQLVNTEDFLDSCQYFKHNLNIPDYAYMLPDGSGRHLWKDLQQPSTWSFTDELYNTTFTNGAFYHHQNIVFPVRRQDPFEKYGMCIMDANGPIQNNFKIHSTEFDNSSVEFIIPNNSSSCF